MGDEIRITVIATGFEDDDEREQKANDIVNKAWERKMNTIAGSNDRTSSTGELDIPTFLRKNNK